MSIEFPFEEKFLDFESNERTFEFTIKDVFVGKCITAKDLNSLYEFSICTTDDNPAWAIGDLRNKIKNQLSIRYLHSSNDTYNFSHDKAKGTISSGGVVIDGKFISFDELSSMMQVYEGFSFELTMRDSTEK
ncbi:hypothetical protein [Halarcobacter sp.]|uniref:DUF7713 domain-containing protein n=1 Tax=Halarcobacter sp. TaxID=2321133 RepID=UPI002AA7EE20|nr:hypothetical protein [Halarcobacter sp.]